MAKFVIDASAWIEYFNGSLLGEKVKEIVERENNECSTNIVTVAELSSSYRRNKLSFQEEKKALLLLSSIFQLDVAFAEEAGKYHADFRKERKSISLADVFVWLTAKKIGGKVITKDEDFRGLPDALIIR